MGWMGSDTIRPQIQGWLDRYNIETFVETGLEKAMSLETMMAFPEIRKLISIEINKKWIDRAGSMGIPDDRVTLLHGSSIDMLPEALGSIEGNAMWWLDAHVPKPDGVWTDGDPSLDDILAKDNAFPMEKELDIILGSRDVSNDVILMDDIRVYDNGAWKKIFAERGYGDTGSSDFILDALSATHTLTRNRADSVYYIALPKE